MITVVRDGAKVRIEVETDHVYNCWFYRDCKEDELYAKLLSQHLREKLDRRIEAIRSEEYERGYKDGRAKRKKATWFTNWFKTGVY